MKKEHFPLLDEESLYWITRVNPKKHQGILHRKTDSFSFQRNVWYQEQNSIPPRMHQSQRQNFNGQQESENCGWKRSGTLGLSKVILRCLRVVRSSVVDGGSKMHNYWTHSSQEKLINAKKGTQIMVWCSFSYAIQIAKGF